MRESLKQKTTRAAKITEILDREYPEAKCHLNYENPFQLLISTILAAQTTDVGVNLIMGELYKKYRSPLDLANAEPAVLEKELNRLNFYRNKTRAVINCSKTLVEKHKSEVPKTMEELTTLAGVGRKTANVVLGNCFGIPAIMTDTHLIRVTQRLRLVNTDVPDKIEMQLKRIIPDEKQVKFSHVIGEHGRQVCKAKKPMCDTCEIGNLCPSKGKV